VIQVSSGHNVADAVPVSRERSSDDDRFVVVSTVWNSIHCGFEFEPGNLSVVTEGVHTLSVQCSPALECSPLAI
jgi:hypothetical protein